MAIKANMNISFKLIYGADVCVCMCICVHGLELSRAEVGMMAIKANMNISFHQ
jgi:hypothetical protein